MPLSCLERYQFRMRAKGAIPRESWLKNTQAWINTKLPASLSYYTAEIDGEERQCAIISSRHDTMKKIITMPGEHLTNGTYVKWADEIWLITSVDPQSEVYQTGSMTQCNYLLKWVNNKGEVISRWVIALDGTKYLTGEYDQNTMTLGDSRLQLTMPRDDETVLVNRGARFLIDDPDADQPMAYELTKVNRSGSVYGGHGVFVHMLSEDNRQDEHDNYELMIANYWDRIGQFSVQFNNANDPLTLAVGDAFVLEAEVYKDGSVFEDGVVEFSSSNKDVVVVSDDGTLTTVSSGEAEITATYLTFSNTINIVVTDEHDPDPGHTNHHISFGDLDQTDSALVGSTIQLKAELYSDGVKDDTAEFTYLIDCDTTIATMSVVDGVATINVNRNRKNIGESFIITATCSQTETTHSKELIVKGWS